MKVTVYIVTPGSASARRICWYTGTSDAQVEMAIRMQLEIPQGMNFLLRDTDDDIVPVSSTLPTGHRYTLVLPKGYQFEDVTLRRDETCQVRNRTVSSVDDDNDDDDVSVITPEQMTVASSSTMKRKRYEGDRNVSNSTTSSPHDDRVSSILPATQSESMLPRSIAPIIAQFIHTFTEPIANDDNVSFIPNSGRFALYALYCQIVQDSKYHPKREDVFYKMTSMHGKVDRQRVVRFYKCLAQNEEGTEFIQHKPQGKGVLLRKYRDVDNSGQLKDVVKSAPFISWLKLDPNEVVALYVRFIHSFTPIVKSDFRAQTSHVHL
ncbi:unnamed protein product [Peronospora belbahrii]|uniref:Uncharacterized protein n=1 Tax=Peronospora belbahrii TaxID=622444 RepID=A0AAU9KXJ1_9STRA|nr:unnamed protein product [Peronospora belbahrii]CAH0517489.1 unnamed protein product [Peronospora belbahrii]